MNEEDDREIHVSEIWTAYRRWGGSYPTLNAVVAQPKNFPVDINTTTELKRVTTTCCSNGTLVS